MPKSEYQFETIAENIVTAPEKLSMRLLLHNVPPGGRFQFVRLEWEVEDKYRPR